MFRKDNSSFDAERFSSAVYGEGAREVREARETAAEKGIRSYGPGKFDSIIDSYAYDVGIDGIDEEVSIEDGGGWYGLLMLDKPAREAISQAAHNAEDELTDEEEDLLADSAAIVFHERSDGIVEVDWFDDKKAADDEWDAIQEEIEEEEEEEEEEAE